MYNPACMQRALELAEEAFADGEIPVGCVVVNGDKIIGEGRNRRERGCSACAHAEIEAIEKACAAVGAWRLLNCELYVTLEPCPMCAGAILNSRIPSVYFGAYDLKAGACSSVLDLFSYPLNHKPHISGGNMEAECSKILQSFFKKLRS